MKKSEELKAAREELRSLAAKMADEEAEVTEEEKARAKELNEEIIPELQDAVEKIADDAELLKGIVGTIAKEEPVEETEPKGNQTIGQKAAAAIREKGVAKGDRVTVAVKASTDNHTETGYIDAITEVQPDILPGARRDTVVADLFAQESTSAAAVSYYVESAAEGDPATVAEGAKYPQIHFGDPELKTVAIAKIGCIYKDTDELLSDATRLAQSIDNQATYRMDVVEEDTIVSTLLGTSGLQTATATSMEKAVDAIKSAKAGIRKNTPAFKADALLVNDEDWDELTSLKDSNGQYLVGGPFIGQYGNGNGPAEEPRIWGLQVVPTQAVAKGTMVVGAFKAGASVIRNGGRTVEVTNSDGTDFEQGLVAFRPSERIALAVKYPAAFVKLTVSNG